MGLVNLRNANVLVLSASSTLANEIKILLEKNKYKGVKSVTSVPEALQLIRTLKTDILITDNDLGATKIDDLLMAIRKAFPKLKVVVLNSKEKGESDYLSFAEISYPVNTSHLIKLLEQAMMEKMGIAVSSVAIDIKY